MTPWHVLLGLRARRRKPRIIRYNHEHPGPAHDGRAQRRCPRICEHSYPSIYDDFVANFANVRNPPSGGQIAELTMEAGAAGCIVNSDETHHKLSNEGERGGSRANTQTDPDLPRTGRRMVANERHITGLHGTTETGASATTSSRLMRGCEPRSLPSRRSRRPRSRGVHSSGGSRRNSTSSISCSRQAPCRQRARSGALCLAQRCAGGSPCTRSSLAFFACSSLAAALLLLRS